MAILRRPALDGAFAYGLERLLGGALRTLTQCSIGPEKRGRVSRQS